MGKIVEICHRHATAYPWLVGEAISGRDSDSKAFLRPIPIK